MTLKILVGLVFMFSVLISKGQKIILTYDDAINMALSMSYTIKEYENDRLRSRLSYNYYKAMFKPRLDFDLFTPEWKEGVQPIYQPDGLPVYNSTGMLRYGGNLQFTYVLPTGGNMALSSYMYHANEHTTLASDSETRLSNTLFYSRFALSFIQPVFTTNQPKQNLKEAKLMFERTTHAFTRGQMDIIYNVSEGFYSLYRVIRTLEITKEKLKNSIETFRVSKLMAESGRLPEGDLMTAEIAVAQDQINVSEAEGALSKQKDLFKLLIGLELNMDFEIMPRLDTDTITVDLGIAIKEGLKNRLEISEAKLNVKLQEISIDRAKREREFKGSISGFYDITGVSTLGEGSIGDLFKSSLNNAQHRPPNRGVTFTISYPISDWGRGKARLQNEKVELLNRELELDNLKNLIIIEIRDIVRTFEENKNKLEIHEKNQKLARRNYKIMELRFENGDISSQELAIERERLSDIQIDYLGSYIAYQLALANLKRKTMWDFQNNRSYRVDIGHKKTHQQNR